MKVVNRNFFELFQNPTVAAAARSQTNAQCYIRSVYSTLQLVQKYLHYYRTAANKKGHGMHSPFVYDFIRNVLNNDQHYAPPESIEQLRKQLLQNHSVLQVEDLGAGSRNGGKQNTIRHLAKTAAKPKKFGQMLFRLARHLQPQIILELGTSLGLSSAYLAAGNPQATVITIEGSAAIQQQAQQNFQQLGMGNLKSLRGAFDDVLPGILQQLPQVDLAFIDGNHRLAPTIHYYESLLQKRTEASVFIFDDIHWSNEMEEAWKQIQQHPEVRYTIDLFFLGLVFFRPEFKVKQHFSIRF